MNELAARRNVVKHASALALCLIANFSTAIHAQTFSVVNMIPWRWSGETSQNSEPTIAAHPTLDNSHVATAFMSGEHFCQAKTSAPVFVSSDDGNTWNLVCILPTDPSRWPMDMTVSLSGDGTALYVGALDFDAISLSMTANVFGYRRPSGGQPSQPLTIGSLKRSWATTLFTRLRTDQPQIAAPPSGQLGIAVVGANRLIGPAPTGDPCTDVFVWMTDDPWSASPPATCLANNRPLVGVGAVPAVRAAMHTDGTLYVILYRPVIDGSSHDVVVYRHDPGTSGFASPLDLPASGSTSAGTGTNDCGRHDGFAGSRVATCVSYPPGHPSSNVGFGQERRLATELSIAIDPQNSRTVYVAWAETSPTNGEHLQLRFATSTDGGDNWTPSPWKVDHATNPALAVASDGAVGILYEQLEGTPPTDRWNTQLAISTNGLASPPELVQWLAKVDAQQPLVQADPYLGDYVRLVAKRRNFYGVFPASNDLSRGTFLNLTSLRNYDSNGKPTTRTGASVQVSIDPYFVRVIR